MLSLLLIFALLFSQGTGIMVVADEPSVPDKPSKPSSPPTPAPPSKPAAPSPADQPTAPLAPTSASEPTVSASPTPSENSSTDANSASNENTSDSSTSPTPTGSSYSTGTLGRQTGNPTYTSGAASFSENKSADDPKNTFTGPYSENFGSLTNSSTTDIKNKNTAVTSNNLVVKSDSGANTASFGTLSGNVFTGDSQATLTLLNKLNSNFTGSGGIVTFDIYNQHVGDIIFEWADAVSSAFGFGNPIESVSSASGAVVENSVTGPFSQNEGQHSETEDVNVENENIAKLKQDITVVANTGGNSASYNTGGGSIKTGDATAFASIINFVNTSLIVENWLIGIVNIFGSLFGNIILPSGDSYDGSQGSQGTLVANDTSGPLSTNEATASSSLEQTLESTNSAKIVNKISIEADSGDNNASLNTLGGSVKTGQANVSVNEKTVANTNAFGDTVWVIIVNELGKWVGYIVGAPWGASTASSNNLPVFDGTDQSGTFVGNEITGPFSQNEAEYSQTGNASVANENEAELLNNITVKATTGDNDAMLNTGPGQIETGDAYAGLNLFNMVNTNVVATKFVVLLVNIFGEFVGSIIPPGSETIEYSSGANDNYIGDSFVGGLLAENLDLVSNAKNAEETNSGPNTQSTVRQQITASEPNNQNYLPILAGQSGGGGTSSGGNFAATFPVSENQFVSSLPRKEVRNKSLAYGTIIDESLTISSLFEAYSMPLAPQFSRGPFVSKAFSSSEGGLLFFGSKYRIDNSWLAFLPIAVFIILIRRKHVFVPIKKYVYMLMEVIL